MNWLHIICTIGFIRNLIKKITFLLWIYYNIRINMHIWYFNILIDYLNIKILEDNFYLGFKSCHTYLNLRIQKKKEEIKIYKVKNWDDLILILFSIEKKE